MGDNIWFKTGRKLEFPIFNPKNGIFQLAFAKDEECEMKRIRIRVTILASWLVLVFITDRLLSPIALSNASIALVFVMVFTTLIMPRKPAALFWILMALPIIALFLIKVSNNTLSGDLGVFLTLFESFLIVITTFLSSWVSAGLNEFESSVAQISLSENGNHRDTAASGLGIIYREVRRARNHQRPLALISIGVEEKSINLAVEKMVEEIQLSMVKQYKLQRLAKMLNEQLEDCAIVVRDTNRFLAVLPETKPDELAIVLERIRYNAHSQVNIDLRIGTASLPDDSYTFEGLLEKATQGMEAGQEAEPHVVLDQKPADQHIS